MNSETFYPKEENLGKTCSFWDVNSEIPKESRGCTFPKAEMEGRTSCEGFIDDFCLFLKDGRSPPSLKEEQIIEIKTRIPGSSNRDLPPGESV